jgi:hypothetical protein
MPNMDKTVLVTGATGRQGGAVIRNMLLKGWKLRALTRSPSGRAAQELSRRGVEVVEGNLEDPASLERAARGVYGFTVSKISGRLARSVKSSRARTWRTRPKKLLWNTLSTVPWVERNGNPASIIGKVSGRLRNTFANSVYPRPCSDPRHSWRTITSTRLKSES